MKFYLEKSTKNEGPLVKGKLFSIVIRGKTITGKRYRIFVKIDGETIRVPAISWDQVKQQVRGNQIVNRFLKDLQIKLQARLLESKISNPLYSIPDAWQELFGEKGKDKVKRLSDRVVEAIDPYIQDNKANKSQGYLRHYTQLKTELSIWNKDIRFDTLNELSLTSYLAYLRGDGEPTRKKALRSSTIGHHFKHLRQVAKYASQRNIKIDPTVFDFNPGKVRYEIGSFDLTFEELMVLWHYKAMDKTEEVVIDYAMIEAFSGIRSGDLFSLKPDGSSHGLKHGDITPAFIRYCDRKNDNTVKTATRHKFNNRIIEKYLRQSATNDLMLPPLAQQVFNRVIKDIARKCGLDRSIRRGNIIRPLHEVISSHCFRATYGNLLFRLGIATEIIREELGHAAIGVTEKHYLKFSNRHDIVREKMNELEITNPPKDKKLNLNVG